MNISINTTLLSYLPTEAELFQLWKLEKIFLNMRKMMYDKHHVGQGELTAHDLHDTLLKHGDNLESLRIIFNDERVDFSFSFCQLPYGFEAEYIHQIKSVMGVDISSINEDTISFKRVKAFPLPADELYKSLNLVPGKETRENYYLYTFSPETRNFKGSCD